MDTVEAPPSHQESPLWRMRLLMLNHMIPRCLYVAARLDLATQLADTAKTANELARQTGVHGPTLHRVLRALASAGIFRETTGSRFENTALSDTLRSDVRGSLRPWVLMHGGEISWRSWGEFDHCVTTGTSAFEHLHGGPLRLRCDRRTPLANVQRNDVRHRRRLTAGARMPPSGTRRSPGRTGGPRE